MNKALDILSILKAACLVAGKIQLEYYKKDIEVSHKELPADLVTEVDLKSQAAIIESLSGSMLDLGFKKEEVGFIGEEGVNAQAQHLFIIDPLDGTSSYVERNDQFSVSIAYLDGEELLAGMVYQPTEDVFYFAEKNKGAFREQNGTQAELKINDVGLSESEGTYNLSSSPEVSKKILEIVAKLEDKDLKVQRSRSVILTIMSVINNQFSFALNGKCKLWDLAAAKLIIEEAGGVIADWQGQELGLDLGDVKKSYAIVVAQKGLISEVINIIK